MSYLGFYCMTTLYDKVRCCLLLSLLIFSCSEEKIIPQEENLPIKVSAEERRNSSVAVPQFENSSFEGNTIQPWIEFTDLGYPTSPFVVDNGSVQSTDVSPLLMQSNFPSGYYRIGVNAKADSTAIVLYLKKGKRQLIELDRYVFQDSSNIAYEFFLTDSVNSIGFQAHGKATVYDVKVYQYQPFNK
ncbi:hypothetical protein [Ohtaekwangia koreensis]|uniref:Uncharacterized protein n=1 Tax=Ohtaekwangia koreensis TaxID=688867 RepID=A0A1T5JQ11_9BACT|nr:hypothetical protein [Ohtaekwangia koreensis]SKC53399.1 hypothetical protein SAMN05660236_1336 [Ohtaekwangia koreensis]